MRLQFLPGIMVALVSLLHTNAYAQLRDKAPQNGVLSRCPSLELASRSQRAYSHPLVSRNEGVVSGSNALTDALSYPFTLARTTPGKIRQLTCDTICAWIALLWTMCG
jgi:hypothetical protein